jgi:hypothetical protein
VSDDTTRIVVGTVLLALVLTGPAVGLDLTDEPVTLDDGTATVEVVAPAGDLRITPGRFGTDVAYLRTPTLVADVRAVEGTPRIVYEVVVPELGIEQRAFRPVTEPGRIRIGMADVEVDRPVNGSYGGYLAVRVQSFETYETVTNRTVEVRAG